MPKYNNGLYNISPVGRNRKKRIYHISNPIQRILQLALEGQAKDNSSGINGKYYLRNSNILPEMVITPKGSSYVKDEIGNPAVTIGALRDLDKNVTINVNKQLKNNQPVYGLTNKQASRLADIHAQKTAPGIGDLIMGGIGKPMNLISPVHWIGALRDWDYKKGWNNIWDDNSGLVNKAYAEKHPFTTLALNMLGDAALGGTYKGIKNAIRIGKNIKDRNLFAYKYITPFSYINPIGRGKNLLYHIIHDPNFKKGEIPVPIEDMAVPLDRRILFDSLEPYSKEFRDEAFRKYLGLPEKRDIYVSNGDGTWRYNSNAIRRIFKKYGEDRETLGYVQFKPEMNTDTYYNTRDFITGNGGTVGIIPGKRTKLTDGLIRHDDTVVDTWDLNPFASWNTYFEDMSGNISKSVRNTADKVYKKLFDNFYRKRFFYNHFGGKQLNNIRYDFDLKNYPKIYKTIRKLGNMEIGRLLKGKPFTMKTPITYYEKPYNIDLRNWNKKAIEDDFEAMYEARKPIHLMYSVGGRINRKHNK